MATRKRATRPSRDGALTVAQLPTPCLLVERHRLDANLERMQARADRAGVALRPHVKTHKSIALARRQRERGARGITVAKVSEAEVFVAAGYADVRVAYPVIGEDKLERLRQLAERARVSFCVDSQEGARAASSCFARYRWPAPVLLKVDCGYGRVGVRWDDAQQGVALAREIAALPGLELIGVLTHAGQSYHGPGANESARDALLRVAADERDRTLAFVERLTAAGVCRAPNELEVSIGSTPTMAVFENRAGDGRRVTEIRPGTYLFNDLTQVALGAAALADCALTVLTTVVSRRRDGDAVQLVLDAGKKILTSDQRHGARGFGLLLADPERMLPHAGAELHTLSEEHGWVRTPAAVDLPIGARLRVVPNHVCVAVNTQDEMVLVDGDTVLERWPVDARGCVT